MHRSPSIPRRVVAAVLASAALLIAGAGAGPASAAPTPSALAPIRIEGQIGNACLEIRAPLKQTMVTLRQKRGGTTLRTASGKTADDRRVVLCVAKLRIGDVLVMKQTTVTRTLTVPTLTVKPNRDETITGRVPTSNLSFLLWVTFGLAGAPSAGYEYQDQLAEVDGTYSVDVSADGFINGSDRATLYWTSPKGDEWLAISPMLPAFVVEAGKAAATIVDKGGRTVTLTLRNSGGTVRGAATATLTNDTKKVTFRKNGDPVTVQVGDRVSTSSEPGRELVVIDPALDLDSETLGGDITVTCFPSGQWRVDVYLADELVHAWGGTSVGGSVNFTNVTQPTADPSGHRVVVSCESSDGFVQRSRGTFE